MASEKKDIDATNVGSTRLSVGESDGENAPIADVFQNAKAATDKERKMTLLQGIRLYPKALAWSILISTCIVMEGYDISLISNFYAFRQFNQKFGVRLEDGTYQVPAPVCLLRNLFGYGYLESGKLTILLSGKLVSAMVQL